MQSTEQVDQRVADLYWLAFLLTGDREQSLDITLESLAADHRDGSYFDTWMSAWARRVVISKALNTTRKELASSAMRTAARKPIRSAPSVPQAAATKAGIEEALLSIDVFPRCVLLLTIFEQMPLDDVVVLMDADRKLVRKAQLLGLQELSSRMNPSSGQTSNTASPFVLELEAQHA